MNLVVVFDFMKKNELLSHKNLLDLSKTCAGELFSGVCYPWEVLPKIKDFILYLGARLPETEYKKIAKDVWVSRESKIFDSAYIEGPTIIQKGSQIRHCAFI
ncbi:MAG: UDP-N-acetylglucosamine pyrophosphorylase, partial [Acutalibacteraceae bacterium]